MEAAKPTQNSKIDHQLPPYRRSEKPEDDDLEAKTSTEVINMVGVASRKTSVTPMLLKWAIFSEAAFAGVLLIL